VSIIFLAFPRFILNVKFNIKFNIMALEIYFILISPFTVIKYLFHANNRFFHINRSFKIWYLLFTSEMKTLLHQKYNTLLQTYANHCMSFSFWSSCLSFFNLRLLIALLISSYFYNWSMLLFYHCLYMNDLNWWICHFLSLQDLPLPWSPSLFLTDTLSFLPYFFNFASMF
jgi:hypothetical protein